MLPSTETHYYYDRFTDEELDTLEAQAGEILNENEWIVPLIPESVVRASIQIYAKSFIDQLLISTGLDKEVVTLEDFKSVAREYVVTYNLKGAKWFKEGFEEACLEELQNRFEGVVSLFQAGLTIEPIRVTSSTGAQAFGEAKVVLWDANMIRGKHVISLDDIGDRGITQKTIKNKAILDGALSCTTVNLIEKIVPDDIDEAHQKKYSPDTFLLEIGNFYVIGWGLDDGKRDETRDLDGIVILCKEFPHASLLLFQGGKEVKN